MIKRKLTGFLKKDGGNQTEIQWSSQSYTLEEILASFKLPCVVRCSDKTEVVQHGEFRFDLADPLLIHTSKWTRRVRVRCLRKDGSTGDFKESHTEYIIPENYDGWFQRIDDPSEKVKPETTLEPIINSPADQVLVAKSLSSLCLEKKNDKSSHFIKRHVSAGEVITLKGYFSGDKHQINKVVSCFGSNGNVGNLPPEKRKFAMCADEKDETLVFDVSHQGYFYKIFDSEESGKGLISVEDLIDMEDRFPLYVKHVYGDLPLMTSAYSSVMKCISVIEEQTILASTLHTSATPLEIQAQSPIRFKICLTDVASRHSDLCSQAMQLCRSEGDDYICSIKTAFKIQKYPDRDQINRHISEHKQSVSESTTFTVSEDEPSAYETGSDAEEEDANSEFAFAWTPQLLIKNKTNSNKGEIKPAIPKFFNSCINSPKTSQESKLNAWNEQPDVV